MPIECFKLPSEAVDLEVFTEKKISRESDFPPAIFFSLGLNPSADGSSYLEYGSIKACCSVNGPLEMRQDGQLITALKFAPFITWQQPDQQTGVERRLSQLLLSSIEASVMLMRQDGQLITALKFAPFITWQQPDQQTGVERRLSQLLLSSIEASVMLHCFPRGKYEVMVLILDNGGFPVDSINTGDCLAAAITCSGLALTDASVQMYDTPVGVNVDLSTVVRPSSSVGHLCAAILPNLQQYSMLYTSDSCIRTGQDLREALSCAMNGGVQLATTIKQCLVRQTNTTA
ncbi:hypothetical protein T265_13360 [Opisthorchis viverrini]|uniref:Exoribonuclease phosphorolytic domain-containing protein n=1 Tax=Opisthorchis viverrini TaxID=6198 RepID=A0A075A1J9_OPIVI|nr:hypothetical protein T265_13360 [Opisthorchis viverrini]KER29435.1 hypothetical protein T265_13360 [Opisthorchis viverrini]